MPHHKSAHLLAFRDNQTFLLIQRKDIPVWVIPGGSREVKETPQETAVREFGEETGIQVLGRKITLVATYTSRTGEKVLFSCKLHAHEKPILTNESANFGFFNIKSLPTPITLYEQRKISEAICSRYGVIKRPDKVIWLSELSALPFTQAFLFFIKYIFLSIRRKYAK